MEITNFITVAVSSIAIVISIFAYFQNSKIQRRQLRIEKLEEMLEITHILDGNYQYFEDTFFFKEQFLNGKVENSDKEKYQHQVEALVKISEEIDLSKKLARLYVLNNSYLPRNKLKEKTGVFITVYTCLAENTVLHPNKRINLPFSNFPKKWEFLDFTNEIQNEIIEEMNLGYKNNIEDNNNFEKVFKERYNL
jgi:hypothetical protein